MSNDMGFANKTFGGERARQMMMQQFKDAEES